MTRHHGGTGGTMGVLSREVQRVKDICTGVILPINTVDRKILSCPKHGKYEGYTTVVSDGEVIDSVCPECFEKEKVNDMEELYERIALSGSRDVFNQSCIPPRYQKSNFGAYKPSCEKAEAVKSVLSRFTTSFKIAALNGTSFLFSGKTGTGKTHLACAIAMNIIRQGHTAKYTSMADVISKVKATWSGTSQLTEDEMIDKFIEFELLIIDEIGLGSLSPKERNIIFMIIDRRYSNNKPTIGISKFPEGKVCQMIGEETVSRLKSGGGGVLVFDWGDYRLNHKKF